MLLRTRGDSRGGASGRKAVQALSPRLSVASAGTCPVSDGNRFGGRQGNLGERRGWEPGREAGEGGRCAREVGKGEAQEKERAGGGLPGGGCTRWGRRTGFDGQRPSNADISPPSPPCPFPIFQAESGGKPLAGGWGGGRRCPGKASKARAAPFKASTF